MIKIVHITDLHLDDELTKQIKLNTRKNFLKVLAKIKKVNPDAVILGGDLGAASSLLWLKKQLDKLKTAYFITTGNHDKVKELVKIFNIKKKIINNKLYFKIKIKNINIIILDSSENFISDNQIEFLKSENIKAKNEILLFMHHPPIKCGCKFMDKNFALNNYKDFFKTLITLKNIKNIFCGHYHTGKNFIKNKKNIYITPAASCQIDEISNTLKIISTNPGYRIIEVKNNELTSKIHYL